MTAEGIETLKKKEYLTIEEMQALLLNMVDEEYSKLANGLKGLPLAEYA